MNKEELVVLIAQRTNKTKKEVDQWLKHFTDIVKDMLSKRQSVRILTFGTFTTTHRKTRHVIHPATKQRIEITGKHVPVFRPAKLLRKLVAGEILVKRRRGRPPKDPQQHTFGTT